MHLTAFWRDDLPAGATSRLAGSTPVTAGLADDVAWILETIANMGPAAVSLLAVGVVPVNPKNLVLVLAARAQAGGSGESTGTIVVSLVLFTLLAASPFIAAIAYVILGGERARVRLDAIREWLMENNRLIMAVVLAVLGLIWSARAGRPSPRDATARDKRLMLAVYGRALRFSV
jgi:hypothetical protein